MAEIDGIFLKVGVDTSEFDTLEDKVRKTFEQVRDDAEKSGKDIDDAMRQAASDMYVEFSKVEKELNSSVWSATKDTFKSLFSFDKDQIQASSDRLESILEESRAYEKVTDALEKYIDEINNGKKNASIFGVSSSQEVDEAVESLGKLKVTIAGVETEYDTLKQAIRSLDNEMKVMAANGQADTDMYNEMKDKLVELQRIQNGVTNSLNTAAKSSERLQAYVDLAGAATSVTGLWQSALVGLGVESENAQKQIAKLQAVQTALNSVMTIQKQLQDRSSGTYALWQKTLSMLGIEKKKDIANTNAQTSAQAANTATMKAARVATIGLRAALMSIGIGLIVAALGYLVEKWDDLVKGFKEFMGISDGVGNAFDKFSEIFSGIGKAIFEFVLTPLKTVATVVKNLMKGEFKKAFTEGLETAKNGLNVVANYSKAANEKSLAIQKEYRIKKAKETEKEVQDYIDAMEAKSGADWKYTKEGNNAYRRMIEARIEQYDKDTDEYKKAINEKTSLDREYRKRQEDEQKKAEQERKKAQEEANKKLAERRKAEESYNKGVKDAEYNAEMSLWQARIDAMDEGLEKSLEALNKKDAEWLAANKRSIEERAKAIKEYELSQGKKGKSDEYYTSVARTQLRSEDIEKAHEESVIAEQSAIYTKLLEKYKSYQEERAKVIDKYEKESGELVAGSNAKGESLDALDERVTELERQKSEALAKLDMEFASKSQEFLDWIDSLADLGLEEIKIKLEEAKAELSKIPIEDLTAQQRAKVQVLEKEFVKLQKEVDKAQAQQEKNQKLTNLQNLQNKLGNVTKAIDLAFDGLEDFGNEWSDTAKKALNATKSIYSTVKSLIQTIVQLGISSLEATEKAAVTTAEAIKQAERSSVILAIIQAALEIAMAMFNLFKKESEITEAVVGQHEAEIEAVDNLIAKYDELIEERKKYGGSISEIYELERQALESSQKENLAYYQKLMRDWKTGSHSLQKQLTEKGTGLRIESHKKALIEALGEDNYNYLVNTKDRQNALYEIMTQISDSQYDALRTTKFWQNLKVKDSNVTDALDRAYDLKNQIAALTDEEKESLRGFSKDDLQDDLLSYFDDVNASIDDIKANFKDLIAQVVKRQLMNKLVDQYVTPLLNKWTEYAASGEEITKNEKDALEEMYTQAAQKFQTEAKSIMDALGLSYEGSSDTATSRGIATASQESVDENNARLTAIQGYTFGISEGVRTMANNSSLILNNVVLIQQATESMNTNVRDLRNDVNDMRVYGVKVLN